MAPIILCVSMIMACRFGLHYWRAMISKVAAQKVSDYLRSAIEISSAASNTNGFRAMLSLLNMTPGLRGSAGRFRAIRTYYFVIETLGRFVPSMKNWSETEMATCSRYLAVLLDRRLERNIAWASEMRGL